MSDPDFTVLRDNYDPNFRLNRALGAMAPVMETLAIRTVLQMLYEAAPEYTKQKIQYYLKGK